MRLWLVRHATPLVAPGVCYGKSDVAAQPAATRALAQAFAAELPPAVRVSCSPLRRCAAVATALHERRADPHVTFDSRLAEMDFGHWEGRRWDDIGPAALEAWTADFASHRPGGGESVRTFVARVAQAFDETTASGADAAWITHAGVIRAAHLLMQGVREIRYASQWPQESLPFGQWQRLDL